MSSLAMTGLDWPLCHGTGAPLLSMTTKKYVLRVLAPWKCCKVFCALVVTVKTGVLRVMIKKVVNYFPSLNLPPPLEKNSAGAHDCC